MMNFSGDLTKSDGSKLGLVCLMLVFASAARAEKVQTYTIPKERPPTSTPAGHGPGDGHDHGDQAHGGPGPVAAPKITYGTPDGWQETGAGQMRVAGFNISGTSNQTAQVAVTPLPGMAGKESLIVNMWRQQVGLPELTAEETAQQLTEVTIAGEAGRMFDMAGNSAAGPKIRIVTAMLHRGGQSWFFKLQGDDELVTAQKANFEKFLGSVKIETAPASAAALPAGHPPITSGKMPGAVTSQQPPKPRQGGPTWTVPAGWKEIDGGQFLFAKFTITGAGGAQAAVNVSTSSGMGGGLAANINRWRAQLGQAPWSEAELAQNVREIDVTAGKASYVELSGIDGNTEQPATILGAKVTVGESTWYYKLMGEPALVAAQKDSFTAFFKGVKY